MFSKALFKQSCKANGTMWAIITFAVCFMLACVMLISGNGNIGETKNAIQDTIVTKEIDALLEKQSISFYTTQTDGMIQFDNYFVEEASDALVYDGKFNYWLNAMPKSSDYSDLNQYQQAMVTWQGQMPTPETLVEQLYAKNYSDWTKNQPVRENYDSDQAYNEALVSWSSSNPANQKGALSASFLVATSQLKEYYYEENDAGEKVETTAGTERFGTTMFAIKPDMVSPEIFTDNNEKMFDDYDVTSLVMHISAGDVNTYLTSEERNEYRSDRAETASSVFLAGQVTKPEMVSTIIDALSTYGVDEEKYASFNYNYQSVRHMSMTSTISYRNRLAYEVGLLDEKLANGEIKNQEEYKAAYAKMNEELIGDVAGSLLSSLPSDVSDALKEVGTLDLYSLIVGSIFYKLAGLLLPIIYMIMASNNLISGQVDSGSMAYVLSTSTKRKTVVFTQAVYLIGSLLAMFGLTTITGCVCLAIVGQEVQLTYGHLILLNVGAFLVLFALSGLCFLTSCWFDRSKRSMAVGGGLSIFALVAAMLGLFGSQVIPSVVRLDALNNFNFVTIITLFDSISIINGISVFIWKFAILFALGLLGYIIGSTKFVKKDLPL